MSVSDSIYGIFFQPVATLRELAQQKPYGRALLLVLAVVLLTMLFQQASDVYNSNELLPAIPANAIWMLNAAGAVLSIFLLPVISGTFSLISEILFDKFNAGGILVALCYASIPGILGPPLRYAASLAGIDWLGLILAGLAMIWVLVLQVIGVREALRVTTGQAVLVMVIPGLLFMLLVIGFAVIAAISMTA